MKKLIMINGTMGVGKTSVSTELLKMLTPGVYLDGDWCWYMHPFEVTEETKKMVLDNITYLLRNFLSCSQYSYVIFLGDARGKHLGLDCRWPYRPGV